MPRRHPLFDPASMRPLTDTEAAWLAGILEGEGCIRLQVQDARDWRSGRISVDRVTMSVCIAMKDEAVVNRAMELVGGHCYDRGDGLRTMTISSHRAMWLLRQVRRFMVGDKSEQADIAIAFQERRVRCHRAPGLHAQELRDAVKISELKRVGVYRTKKGPRATRLEAALERQTQSEVSCTLEGDRRSA